MRLALVLALSVCVALAQKRPITHEDVYLMKRTGEPAPSPDGRWIVFPLVEPDYDPAKTISDLWIVRADGSAPPRRLTSTKSPESGVAWSPDSGRIAFAARREGDSVAQLYVLSLDGGEAQRVTNLEMAVSEPKWRRDGKALLFQAPVKGPRMAPPKSTARVYDTFPIRFWNYWLDESRPHLFVVDAEPGAAPRDILAGSKLVATPGYAGIPNALGSDRSLQAEWSPDGKEVVFTAVINSDETMFADTESQLFRVSPAGGEPVMITKRGSSFTRPRFSPDGKWMYAQSSVSSSANQIFHLTRLARYEWPNMAAPVWMGAGWDRGVGSFVIAPDGSATVSAEDDGFDKIFRLQAREGGAQLIAASKQGGYSDPVYAGKRPVARYGSSTQPPEIVVIEGGTHKLLTNFNAERLAALDLPAPEHFWFTAKNGKRIHNLILFPPGFDKNKKYPLITFPHGGPNAMAKDAFSTRWNLHLLTAPGYILLETNYTGSTGFGEKFADDIERDVLRGPAQEILQGIEEAGKRFLNIDLTRQAAIGASYGGYLMNWLNGHTTQFRCFVNHAGAANNESQYGANDGGLSRELRMGGPIWESKGQWMDQSPIRYARNWRTPMLITQGEQDFRVPINESITTFKVLKRLKVPARMVIFPDEGHWILKGENNRHHMQEVMAWLKKYLEPADPVWRAAGAQ